MCSLLNNKETSGTWSVTCQHSFHVICSHPVPAVMSERRPCFEAEVGMRPFVYIHNIQFSVFATAGVVVVAYKKTIPSRPQGLLPIFWHIFRVLFRKTREAAPHGALHTSSAFLSSLLTRHADGMSERGPCFEAELKLWR